MKKIIIDSEPRNLFYCFDLYGKTIGEISEEEGQVKFNSTMDSEFSLDDLESIVTKMKSLERPKRYEDSRVLKVGNGYVEIKLALEDLEFICDQLPESDPLAIGMKHVYDNASYVQGYKGDETKGNGFRFLRTNDKSNVFYLVPEELCNYFHTDYILHHDEFDDKYRKYIIDYHLSEYLIDGYEQDNFTV